MVILRPILLVIRHFDSSSSVRGMPAEEKIDDKTNAVFKRKGYKILKALSSGAFGQVYKAQNTKTGESAAVKVMNLEKVDKNIKNKFLPREMAAMIESVHKNVIRVFDIFKSNKRIYIFMEFAGNGDVMGYLKKNGPIEVHIACYWFRQTCEGLEYIHDTLLMAHRDIKMDNILLDEQNNAKLSDFGFAKKSYDSETEEVILSETYCGTEPFYSPQIVKRVAYDPFKADIWAMGVVLFAMINDKYPFHFGDHKNMLKEQMDPEHISNRYIKPFCKHVKHLIKKMFEYKESDRISAKDILEDKWIKEKAKCCKG